MANLCLERTGPDRKLWPAEEEKTREVVKRGDLHFASICIIFAVQK